MASGAERVADRVLVCRAIDCSPCDCANHYGGHAVGAARHGSHHELRRDHQHSRLHDLRHAVRDRYQLQGPAADGREVAGVAGWQDLYLHLAQWAEVARWRTGQVGRLRPIDQALGRTGLAGPGHDGPGVRDESDRRQDLPDRAQGTQRYRAERAGKDRHPDRLHDAQAHSRDAFLSTGHGIHRLGTVQVRGRRVQARPQGGLREEQGLRAAQRTGELDRGRQGSLCGPGRMDCDAR